MIRIIWIPKIYEPEPNGHQHLLNDWSLDHSSQFSVKFLQISSHCSHCYLMLFSFYLDLDLQHESARDLFNKISAA